jgi:hypothetical protein
MSIITSNLRTENAKLFVESFDFNEFFLFASSLTNIGTLTNNSEFSKREFLEKTIFGKRIVDGEVYFAIPINRWQSNEIYTQYDDREDLSNKRFYVVVYPGEQSGGDYHIYKCLFNNYGSESLHAPNYSINVPNQIYRTPDDGYVWKHMFTISDNDFRKYNTLGLIPIVEDFINENGPKSIDQIFVENQIENVGYESVEGEVVEVFPAQFRYIIRSGDFNELTSYYNGQSLYVENPGTGEAKLYQISSYSFNVNNGLANITIKDDEEDETFIQPNFNFTILPRVEIKGDGIGAKAFPVIENSQIVRIEIYNGGVGYTKAVANVVDPLFGFNPDSQDSLDKRAVLRPIISPAFGHGTSIVEELLAKHVLLYTGITFIDNSIFPTTNTFSKIGLVRNPKFQGSTPDRFDNRIFAKLNINPLSVGDLVLQVNNDTANAEYELGETFFSAIVHETNADDVYLTDFMGPFRNHANTSVSFNEEEAIQTPQGQLLNIATDEFTSEKIFSLPTYIQKTGEVLYMSEFTPIERSTESNEQFKLILEF